MSRWTPSDSPDLSGKVAIVTGANRGLGFEAARMLAENSATVVLAVRSTQRGDEAADAIRKSAPKADLDVMPLDLSDLSSVRSFAHAFQNKYDRLDILMNSAGIMAVPESKTEDGFERQFGVNHLGHFALTGLLFHTLTATEGSRVVNVSSMAANNGKIQWDDLNYTSNYSRFGAYGQSKLANLLFTIGLQKRLAESGASTISVAAHPGFSATDLQAGTEINIPIITPILFRFFKLLAMDAAKGAQPQVRSAVDPAVEGGEYYGPNRNIRGHAVKVAMPSHVSEADAEQLWVRSEEMTGVRYGLEPLAAD